MDLRSSLVSVPCTRELVCSSYFPRNGDSKHPVSGRQVRLPKSWVTDLESLDLMDYARTGVAVANIGLIACSDAVKAAVIDGYGTAVSNIGQNADYGLSISDLLGYAPLSSVTGRSDNGFHPEVSILGLDDGDFPLIHMLSGFGKGFSGKGNSASLSSVLGHSQPIRFAASLRILGFGPFVENANGSSSILSSDPTRSRPNRFDGGIGSVFEGVAVSNVGTGSSNVQCSRLDRFGGVRPIFASPIVESEDFREAVPLASVRLRMSTVDVITDAAVSLLFDLSDLGFSALGGMSVYDRQIQRFIGGFIARTSRIDEWFSGPDLKGSELRALDPSHEGGKALPSIGVSVTGFDPGSPNPVDGGNDRRFDFGVGDIQDSWKGKSADGSHGRDDLPTTTICRRSAMKNGDLSVPDPGEGDFKHSVPTPTLTGTTRLGLFWLSTSSGRVPHGNTRAPVTVTSRMTESDSQECMYFCCCWGPNSAEVSCQLIWVTAR